MKPPLYIQRRVTLKHRTLYVDGKALFTGAPDLAASDFLLELYRFLSLSYPRFFKMDALSKTLFLTSEALLAGSGIPLAEGDSTMGMVFYNGHSSLETDQQFQATIQSDHFFPSPSLFICTLPNVALGELAIRNRFMGENVTFIAPNFDAEGCVAYVESLFWEELYSHVLCGWFDYITEEAEADIFLISKELTNKTFHIDNLKDYIYGSNH